MGLKPDKITHHFMVATFAKAGVFKMADDYIQDIIESNELPTMDMYDDLVTEACKRNFSLLVRGTVVSSLRALPSLTCRAPPSLTHPPLPN